MVKSNRGSALPIAIVGVGLFVIIIFLAFSGPDREKVNLPADTAASDIVPENIPSYSKVETNNLINKASGAVVGLAVAYTTQDVDNAYDAAKITGSFIQCYQEAGAFDSSGFYKERDPLLGGVIVVVDEAQTTDPDQLFDCVIETAGKALSAAEVVEYRPCFEKFIIDTDFNSFYVLIAGTDVSVCKALKDAALS